MGSNIYAIVKYRIGGGKMKNNQVKNLIIAGMCVAIGIILPMAMHSIPNAGRVFLPMHIPILICGLACGWQYGLLCGILTPLLSSLMTSMPPMAMLPGMLCELAVYGAVTGIIINTVHTKSRYVNLYIALITAMISGRVVMGILNALIFQAGNYAFKMWIAGAFVTAVPGIVIQILLIPTIVYGLQKAKLISNGTNISI